MKTPIFDFVCRYAKGNNTRLHMPGHKGKELMGFEKYDITEIDGADCLYRDSGIIKESQENASRLFGSGKTLYSCEGSSLTIRAMMHMIRVYKGQGYVLAGRNAHSSFISACALCGLDVEWIFPKDERSYLSCVLDGEKLEKALACVDKMPVCVYVTSPDYLGNVCDISSLARVCRERDIPLVVDNAHGSYLKFLNDDLHPITKGATMCADSAHKTLPVLTGGGYLHISRDAPRELACEAENAMRLFASTSPSYLILSSLDKANELLAGEYSRRLNQMAELIKEKKKSLTAYLERGAFVGDEPLKITIETTKLGHRGGDFAKILMENNIFVEFYDHRYLVLMASPENEPWEIEKLFSVLGSIEIKEPILENEGALVPPQRAMGIREAAFSKRERVEIDNCVGRVLATSAVSCPPAVSLIVCGEVFNESIVALCKKQGITHCDVVTADLPFCKMEN